MKRLVVLLVPILFVAYLAGAPGAAAATGTLDQSQTNTSENGWVWDSRYIHAQTFKAGLTGTLSMVSVYLDVQGADSSVPGPDPDLTVSIWATDGNGLPTGSQALASTTLRATSSGAWNDVTFSPAPSVVTGTVYVIEAQSATSLYINWATDCAENYGDGQALILDQHYQPASWQTLLGWSTFFKSPVCGRDHAFSTYVLEAAAPATPTPAPTADPTATPVQSVAGETAAARSTPPPTSTGGNGSSGAVPVALLISLVACGLGAVAATSQRARRRG